MVPRGYRVSRAVAEELMAGGQFDADSIHVSAYQSGGEASGSDGEADDDAPEAPGTWQWAVIGMKVKLPGSIWGQYAQNDETRAWARVHAKDKFEVIVRKRIQSSGAWVVQAAEEMPFPIREKDLLLHVRGRYRQELSELGAPFAPSRKSAAAPKLELVEDEATRQEVEKDRLAAEKKAWQIATEYVKSTNKTAGTDGKPQSRKSHLRTRPISIDSVVPIVTTESYAVPAPKVKRGPGRPSKLERAQASMAVAAATAAAVAAAAGAVSESTDSANDEEIPIPGVTVLLEYDKQVSKGKRFKLPKTYVVGVEYARPANRGEKRTIMRTGRRGGVTRIEFLPIDHYKDDAAEKIDPKNHVRPDFCMHKPWRSYVRGGFVTFISQKDAPKGGGAVGGSSASKKRPGPASEAAPPKKVARSAAGAASTIVGGKRKEALQQQGKGKATHASELSDGQLQAMQQRENIRQQALPKPAAAAPVKRPRGRPRKVAQTGSTKPQRRQTTVAATRRPVGGRQTRPVGRVGWAPHMPPAPSLAQAFPGGFPGSGSQACPQRRGVSGARKPAERPVVSASFPTEKETKRAQQCENEPQMLFRLHVKLGLSKGVVHLKLFEGAVPETVSQQFASKYGLNTQSRHCLTRAITAQYNFMISKNLLGKKPADHLNPMGMNGRTPGQIADREAAVVASIPPTAHVHPALQAAGLRPGKERFGSGAPSVKRQAQDDINDKRQELHGSKTARPSAQPAQRHRPKAAPSARRCQTTVLSYADLVECCKYVDTLKKRQRAREERQGQQGHLGQPPQQLTQQQQQLQRQRQEQIQHQQWQRLQQQQQRNQLLQQKQQQPQQQQQMQHQRQQQEQIQRQQKHLQAQAQAQQTLAQAQAQAQAQQMHQLQQNQTNPMTSAERPCQHQKESGMEWAQQHQLT